MRECESVRIDIKTKVVQHVEKFLTFFGFCICASPLRGYGPKHAFDARVEFLSHDLALGRISKNV